MPRPPARRANNPASIRKYLAHSQEARLKVMEMFRAQLDLDDLLEDVKHEDGLFASILDVAASEYGVRYQDLAERIGMSPAAVGRWAKQTNLPVPLMRPLVIEKIAELLDEELQRQKDMKPILKRGRIYIS